MPLASNQPPVKITTFTSSEHIQCLSSHTFERIVGLVTVVYRQNADRQSVAIDDVMLILISFLTLILGRE